PSFQTHRSFRARSSRLRKDRAHNGRPVFDNRTLAAPSRSRIPTPHGRRCARRRFHAHKSTPLPARGRPRRNPKPLIFLTGDVDPVDSVDSISGAPRGNNFLPAANRTMKPLPAACCLLPAAPPPPLAPAPCPDPPPALRTIKAVVIHQAVKNTRKRCGRSS